jgi:hypothetical protein
MLTKSSVLFRLKKYLDSSLKWGNFGDNFNIAVAPKIAPQIGVHPVKVPLLIIHVLHTSTYMWLRHRQRNFLD